jgi:hypothetical protein
MTSMGARLAFGSASVREEAKPSIAILPCVPQD